MSSSLSPIASMLQANPNTAGVNSTLSPQQQAQQQLNYAAVQDPNSLLSFKQNKQGGLTGGGFRRLRGRQPSA